MYGVDGLQGPDHHPELHDVPRVIAPDDVDAVDVLADDRRLELEHGYVASEDLLRVVKRAVDRVAGQRLGGRTEVHRRQGLAALWRIDDRRIEDDVVRQQIIQRLRALARNDLVPGRVS